MSTAAASATAPTRPASARLGRLLLRLLIVVVAFAALPLALHEPFRLADAERRVMLLRNAQDQASVIVAALRPLLDRSDPRAVERINAAAKAYADNGTTLRIVHSPRAVDSALLVAAFPPVDDRDFATIRERLRQADGAGLDRARCTGSGPLESRIETVDGSAEILGAAAMSGSAEDCWTVLVGWRSAPFVSSSLGRPFWATTEMRWAALGYLGLLALVMAMLVRGWRDTRALAHVDRLVQRRAAGATPEPQLEPLAPASVLSPAQQTSIVATLREAAAASAAVDARRDRPEIELRKQVADRVFDVHDACEQNGLSLSYEALHPVQVLATGPQVDGIIGPLLRRALSASRPGDVLRVALRIGDDDARIHVEDAGRNASGVVPASQVTSDDTTTLASDGKPGDADAQRAPHAPDDDLTEMDPIIIGARRDLEAIGGALDILRLKTGALRVTARFPRAPESDD